MSNMGVGDVGVMLGIDISVMLLPAVNLLFKVELQVSVNQMGFVITIDGCNGRQHLHTLFHSYTYVHRLVCALVNGRYPHTCVGP